MGTLLTGRTKPDRRPGTGAQPHSHPHASLCASAPSGKPLRGGSEGQARSGAGAPGSSLSRSKAQEAGFFCSFLSQFFLNYVTLKPSFIFLSFDEDTGMRNLSQLQENQCSRLQKGEVKDCLSVWGATSGVGAAFPGAPKPTQLPLAAALWEAAQGY